MLETDKAKMNRSPQAPQAAGTKTDYTKFKNKHELHKVLEIDADRWADAFCQFTRKGLPKNADIDHKATAKWFNDAMLAAFDYGHKHGHKALDHDGNVLREPR